MNGQQAIASRQGEGRRRDKIARPISSLTDLGAGLMTPSIRELRGANPRGGKLADDENNAESVEKSGEPKNFQELEKRTVDAFNRWHQFHNDLVKLGDFVTHFDTQDQLVDLVSFFVMDEENTVKYRDAIENQIAFLAGVSDSLNTLLTTLDEYEEKQLEGNGE